MTPSTQVMTPPQFTAQVPGPNGQAALVTVRAASDMPYASAGAAYLTPFGQRLLGKPMPARNPQTMTAGQSFSLAIQPGAAYAVGINVDSVNSAGSRMTFAKVLILPGAPAVTGVIQTDDPYFALEQVAVRTGQAMLVDGGWKDKVTLDLQGANPKQALQSVLDQVGAQQSTEASGVVDITK